MDLMFAPLRKYADFYGRATRTEFWLFFLFRALIAVAFCIAFIAVAAPDIAADSDSLNPTAFGIIAVGIVVYLALLLPELAVTVRRLHDQDMTGWLALLKIAPMGDFVLFIFMLLPGTAGTNRHGSDPRLTVELHGGMVA